MNSKKWIVGAGVLGVFVIYSLGIRHNDNKVVKPPSLASAPSSSNNNSSNSSTSTNSNASSGSSSTSSSGNTGYKDGTYTGSVADAFYGNVQVQATISGGKLTDVKFLQYPNTHSTSVEINQQAMPYLRQEALEAQNSNVQIISGATFTSQAFSQSLASALQQANG